VPILSGRVEKLLVAVMLVVIQRMQREPIAEVSVSLVMVRALV
jgi:hypothetical protein